MNFKKKGNEKQRFSLRKLNCGLVSVLVGMAFFGPVAFSIEADGEKSVTTETVVQKSAQQTAQDQNIVETTTRSEKTEEVTTTSQDEETTKNVKTYTISNNLMFGSQTRFSNKTGYYTSDKAYVETDVDFTIQTTLINTFDSSLTGGIGIQYLPRKGIENSTFDVLLTGPVTPAPEFKVQYTVDTPTRDRSQDNDQLTWTDSVSDYSKVTAVRFVQTGSTFPNYNDFYLPVKTTDPLKVEDVAYTQVGLKATQFEKFIMSNPLQIIPRIWTEDFVLIDKNGNKLWNIAQQKTATKKFVAFTDEEFPGVRYIRSSEYSKGNVIHFYVPTGSVKVNYQDEAGNPIKDSVVDTLNAPEGNLYDTTEHKLPLIKTDEGKLYDLLPDATKGTEKGEVEKDETEVTYVYKERAKGEVVVKYVIEGTSDEIKDAVTDTPSTYLSDENGTQATYDTTDQKPSTITKDGKEYQLVEKAVPNEKGNLVEGTTTITYEYKLVTGTVTVKYEDENGQPIKEELPNTGTGVDSVFFSSAAISVLMGLGLLKSRKKDEEEGK